MPPPAPAPAPASQRGPVPGTLSDVETVSGPAERAIPPRGSVPPTPVADPTRPPVASVPTAASTWAIHEPGSVEPSAPPAFADTTWNGGLPAQPPASFEPGPIASPDADTWGAPPPLDPERHAEELVARGELIEAMRIFQELALREPRLWARVAEVARLLQGG